VTQNSASKTPATTPPTITDPQADLNLGIKTYLHGALISNIALDTSQAATDTIDYVTTDQSDLIATSTRTVAGSRAR
jgi:purine nucleoside permease